MEVRGEDDRFDRFDGYTGYAAVCGPVLRARALMLTSPSFREFT